MPRYRVLQCLYFLCATACVGGCEDLAPGGAEGALPANPPVDSPYQDFFDRGVVRYVGTPVVTPSRTTRYLFSSRVTVHHFENEGRGPLCMRGDPYWVETREGKSDDLMIFLQGGGVCLDEICAATVTKLLSLRTVAGLGDFIGLGGLLDRTDRRNPLAEYDVVHAPYCDGSIFLGDVDRELSDGNPRNGTNDLAYQRGLLNLTATFEVARRTHPNPRRIVLAGSSGGSYGVLPGVVLARYYYPNTELVVLADSGAPILTSEDPGFLRRIVDQIGAGDILPASCADCLDNGHTSEVIAWALERDPLLSFVYLGHARDHVIGEYFMGSSPEEFEASVVRETGSLSARFPDQVFRFIVPGARHTLTLDGQTAGDNLTRTVLALFGPLAFTGDDVSGAELGTWTLGGMREAGTNEAGESVTGYDWLRTVLESPATSVDVVDLTP